MVGQWLLTLMHHTRGLFLFQDLENPSNRNAPIGTKWFTDSLFIEEKVISGSTISVLLLAIFLSYIFVNVIRNWVISKLQKVMDKDLMTLFIERLFRLPIQFFENRTSGDLLFRANSNIYIRQILSTTFVSLFVDIIMVVTYFFIMLIYSIKLSLYLTGFVALIILVMVIHSRILRKMNDKYVKSQTNVQSLVSESINTVSDIKVFGLEKKLVHEWTDLYDEQLKSGYKINLWNGFIYSLTGSVQYIIPLFLCKRWGNYCRNINCIRHNRFDFYLSNYYFRK